MEKIVMEIVEKRPNETKRRLELYAEKVEKMKKEGNRNVKL